MQTPTPSVGVVVGRFQVATLHAGHHYLLDYAESRHETLLIVIGTTQGFPNKKNPLSYTMREAMLRKAYPHAVILPHGDHPSNDEWSKELDLLIAHHFPGEEALLYGSRDSFIPHYRGKNKTIEVPQIAAKSGTDYRREASAKVLQSPAFRRGVIHTQEKRFPIPYPAVDVAIINPHKQEVLLGAKTSDGNNYRFIGGFVDTTDTSLEHTTRREAYEETSGIEIGDIRYVGSLIVDDWRYRGTGDVILSSFFCATYVFGAPRPADDIARLAWIPYDRVLRVLAPGHEPLGKLLMKHLAQASTPSVQPMLDQLEELNPMKHPR